MMQKPLLKHPLVGLLVIFLWLHLLFAAQLPSPWGSISLLAVIVFGIFVVYKEYQAVQRKP